MCGILGSVNLPVDKGMLDTICHRGPDWQGIYTDKQADCMAFLAHCRLSVVDLSASGNQPMTSPCGNYTLIFNGEIYNHLELRAKLENKRYEGHSDTETLLYFLIEKGITAINELNGIFSFIFYDKKNRKLFMARDPYGVKPLYYHIDKDRFIACSEIRPLRKVLNPSMNIDALRILLNLRYVPAPYTLYDAIFKVRSGHYGVIDMSQSPLSISLQPYAKMHTKRLDIDFEEAIDEYGKRIQHAVCRQLMGDVDIGILLSGGIDSALISNIASKEYNRRLKAFTVGFDSRYSVNEIEWAEETAQYVGLEHHVIKIDADDFFDSFVECTRITEEPLGDTSIIPMYYLAKLASQHVKVVLSGQGADEPLGGYPRYQGEILRDIWSPALFRVAEKVCRLIPVKNESILRGARALGIHDEIERFFQEYCLFTVNEANRLLGTEGSDEASKELLAYFHHLATAEWQTPVERMMSLDMKMNLSDDLLAYTDKISMNFSLECRVPMLDHELINFMEALPTLYKIRRGKGKIIHKAFACRQLPQKIVDRPKLGFRSPTDIWFREYASIIEDKLAYGPLQNYLSMKEIKKVIRQHQSGYNREKQIFLFLSINEWIKL